MLALFSFLRYTHIPWYLGLALPLGSPRENDRDLIAVMFEYSAIKAKALFPNSRFIIAFLFAPLGEKEIPDRIKNAKTSFEFENLNTPINSRNIELKYFPDGHFFPESNKALAKMIMAPWHLEDFLF